MNALKRICLAAVLAALAVSAAVPAMAADAQGVRMKAAFDDWVVRYGVQNASMAAMRGEAVITQGRAGTGKPDDREPLASLSKAITGVCIVKLVEAKQLKYTSRLGALIPDYFRANRPADARTKQITVGELLNHSAGVKYDPTQGTADFAALDFAKKNMPEQLALAFARPLEDKTYFYNNINFLALGMVIEAVTGQPYETYCNKTVLKPAGVVGARLFPKLRVASSYGGWEISALDYVKFLDHFRPKSKLMRSKPTSWPLWDFGNGAYYGIGTYQRASGDSFNFWHSGAWYWSEPARYQNFGTYFAVIKQDLRWAATYSPQPPSGAVSNLDTVMYLAAYPSAGAEAPAAPSVGPQTPPEGWDRGDEDLEIGARPK